MPDGKLRAYYWSVFTALAETSDLLDPAHPGSSFPSEDEVDYTAALRITWSSQPIPTTFIRAPSPLQAATRRCLWIFRAWTLRPSWARCVSI